MLFYDRLIRHSISTKEQCMQGSKGTKILPRGTKILQGHQDPPGSRSTKDLAQALVVALGAALTRAVVSPGT